MSRRHVLLIDDEDDIREVVALSLQAIGGWQVSSAGGGAAGIEMARAEHPDAILLDVTMPDVDGPETLRRLQADPQTQDIPVIFLTAKAQHADRASFEGLGVRGTVTKPFDPMTLADEIDTMLNEGDGTP